MRDLGSNNYSANACDYNNNSTNQNHLFIRKSMKRKQMSPANSKEETSSTKRTTKKSAKESIEDPVEESKVAPEKSSEPTAKNGHTASSGKSLINKDTLFDSITDSTAFADFPRIFDALAEEVLNGCMLVVCGKQLRFREIEFYINHPNHPDKYTHSDEDQKRPGCWYFHKYGKSYKGGTYKGLDISIGGKNHYGGILIRSLLNKETGEIIEGSCLCVDHIIKIIEKAFPGTDAIVKIVGHPNYKEKVLDQTGLIHIERMPEKVKYYKGPRVGLGPKYPEYLNKLYRYVVLPAKVKKGKDTLIKAMLEEGIDKREVQRLTGSTLATVDKVIAEAKKGEKLSKQQAGININESLLGGNECWEGALKLIYTVGGLQQWHITIRLKKGIIICGARMETTKIRKSPIDNRGYSYKTLSNALRVVFVSDPQAIKAAVSLSVAAGSMHDPDEVPGLAHFCEHMVFMGTVDHPQENAFDEFLSKNGGTSNAETDQCLTHFFFDCSGPALRSALELFTGFFTGPLFSSSAVSREIEAIDSEFSGIKKDDHSRLHWLSREHLNQKNPINKPGHGSKESLNVPDLRGKVSAFYAEHYSANLMTVVIYGPYGIPELESVAVPFLEKIPNKNLPSIEAQLTNFPKVYGEEYSGRLFKVVPTKVKRKLILKWHLPYYASEYKTKPYNYMFSMLGHEGPNSLLSYLKKKQWATSVISETSHEYPAFSTLGVTVKLTDQGENEWESVAEAVFGYIKTVQHTDLVQHKYILEEIEYMSNLNFAYKSKEQYIDYVRNISEALHWYPPENVLDHAYLYSSTCFDEIRKFNSMLTPSRADIFLLTRRAKSIANSVHKPWGTKYSVTPLPEDFMKKLLNPRIPSLVECSLPPRNEFIPYEVPPKTSLPPSVPEAPTLLQKTLLGELWYLYDTSFNIPKTIITMKLLSDNCGYGSTMEGIVFASMYEKVVVDILSEFLYMGKLAGISVMLDFSGRGNYGVIQIKSYSSNIVPFIRKLFQMLTEISIEKHYSTFQKQHEKYMKSLESFALKPPDEQMLDYYKSICYTHFFLPDKLLPVAERLTFEKFISQYKQWLKQAHYTLYLHGTISEADAMNVAKVVEENLLQGALRNESIPEQKLLKIPAKTSYVYIKAAQEEDEENSTLASYFQGEPKSSLKESAIMSVLNKFMEEKGFNVLRTQEQLGYSVAVVGFSQLDVLGVLIFIESNRYCPEMLVSRVNAFLEILFESLHGMKIEEFKHYVESAKIEFLEKDVKLKDKVRRIGKEIFESEFEYNRKEKMIKEIDTVTKEEVLQFAKEILIEKAKRLDLEIVCKSHMKQNKKLFQQNTKKCSSELGINRVKLDSLDKFKAKAGYYPDFTKSRYLAFLNSLLTKSQPYYSYYQTKQSLTISQICKDGLLGFTRTKEIHA
eukprot:TRINITY_DN71_c0_g1_i2.p1 TRINITY_DN71_c0_g1~~TRINITY_DN71_c0_g1_i2.p1  ORF type:complete len:1405 (+),score=173.34 TRINITY_DN71_c0_g1_i2:13186-17400(+)